MLQIKNLSMTHIKDRKEILSDFSLSLKPGDRAAVIGEEGNGKSSLLKWIYDPELVRDYIEFKGERILGNTLPAYLPQELPEDRAALSVCSYFSEEDAFYSVRPGRLRRMAAEFNLKEDIFTSEQSIGSLSGGEKIKVQLMKILIAEPDLILLDEPTNDLDIKSLQWMESFINSFEGIVLFISHDETLIEHTANIIIHLERLNRKSVSRCSVFRGSYSEYTEERRRSFANQSRQALSDRREQQIRDEKYRRISQAVEHELRTVSRQDPSGGRLLKKKMHAVKAMEKRFQREDKGMTEMPQAELAINLRKSSGFTPLPRGKNILELSLPMLTAADGRILSRNIQLSVRGCEKISIIGDNGCGKTTLIRMIARELLSRSDLKAMYMPQNYGEELELSVTPVDYLDISGDKDERSRIKTFLSALRYTVEEMEHPISELSGGQKAKILILKMVLSDANVLILDEPTRNFSPLSAPLIRKLLADFPAAVISVSHDRLFLSQVPDRIYRLSPEGLVPAEDFL